MPASATAATEDGYYCRYVRGLTGAFSYQRLSTSTELVPITEVHTAANVNATLSYSQNVTVGLSGGLTVGVGGWDLSATSGASRSITISRDLPPFGGNRHQTVYAVWGYQTLRVVCYTTDPRSGQVVRRDETPRLRYVPTDWTTELRIGPSTRAVPRCASGRSGDGVGRARVVPGKENALGVTWGTTYSGSMALKTIGVSATASASSGSSNALRFWTSSGSSWVCGNAARLDRSSVFFANAA